MPYTGSRFPGLTSALRPKLTGTTSVLAARYYPFLSFFGKKLTAAYYVTFLFTASNWHAHYMTWNILDTACPKLCCHLAGWAFSFPPSLPPFLLPILSSLFIKCCHSQTLAPNEAHTAGPLALKKYVLDTNWKTKVGLPLTSQDLVSPHFAPWESAGFFSGGHLSDQAGNTTVPSHTMTVSDVQTLPKREGTWKESHRMFQELKGLDFPFSAEVWSSHPGT